MSEKKGLAYYKDWIYIIMFIIAVIGGVVKVALVNDQVERNTKAIDEADLKVLVYKIEQIDEKVDKIYELVK